MYVDLIFFSSIHLFDIMSSLLGPPHTPTLYLCLNCTSFISFMCTCYFFNIYYRFYFISSLMNIISDKYLASLLYRKFLPSLFDNIWCCMQFDTSCSFIDIVCAPLLLTSCVEDEERRRNVSVYILCLKEKLCWKKITKVIEGVIRKNHC